MYRYILFDLDGTLTDPKEGITGCLQYALAFFGIHAEKDDLIPFIGPPLTDAFMKYYGFSYENAVKAVDKYRERFGVTGLFENKVYPGIPEMLEVLKAEGRCLAVATSKPEVYAKKILDRFELSQYFDLIAGSEFNGRRVNKDEVIAYAMEKLGIPEEEKRDVLMVGDREHDVIGALKNGIDCMGVYYGYAAEGELERAGAAYTVPTVEALGQFLSE